MPPEDTLCGLFGGTFDPIHNGHLAPVKEAMDALALDRVDYIPSAEPPHRPPPCASARHRLAMTRIALAAEPRLTVDDVELKRGGRSYTVDTVQTLRRRHPERRYALLIGLDALLGLPTWRDWRALQHSVHIIAIARPGWLPPQPLPSWWRAARVESADELRRCAGGKILCVAPAPVAISATEVRAKIASGGNPGEWLPPGVWDYICEHNLYGR